MNKLCEIANFITQFFLIHFRSVNIGYLSIKSGESEVVVAGGQESMSRAPHTINVRNGLKMGDGTLTDSVIFDGLTDAFTNIHMGVTGKIERNLRENIFNLLL